MTLTIRQPLSKAAESHHFQQPSWSLKMIKAIIRKICSPFQRIFDGIRHKQGQRKMMSFVLKIGHEFNCYPEDRKVKI